MKRASIRSATVLTLTALAGGVPPLCFASPGLSGTEPALRSKAPTLVAKSWFAGQRYRHYAVPCAVLSSDNPQRGSR